MAAGKSTVGRKLARLLRCKFIDLDEAIEQKTGVPVSHIFEIEGEPGFRKREAKLLAEVAGAANGAVIATGGGVILREDNREVMRATGTVIYLRAGEALLIGRLKGARASRPLLRGDYKADIARMLAERGPIYAGEADITVDVRATSPLGTARHIRAMLLRHHNGEQGVGQEAGQEAGEGA